ncbi:DNA methyltransferase [Neomoorella humiferrea]|uniref:Methyltransferase n=1 Tax=Neomoorella humiferrea TaxID=676965 RepID=A0A2T0ATH8_9FIRM|nr:DNA methyltransferase [Moorella humiferrea]PRR73697.1 DNA methylase [Moorella humiferrea]
MTRLETPTVPRSAARWLSFGPYYAMFPVDFVLRIVHSYTAPGDGVLDPFAGRGTSVSVAMALGRWGFGVEINPVGWLYGRVKIAPADVEAVIRRLEEVGMKAGEYEEQAEALPEFYHWCFSAPVRRFLLAARDLLIWREDPVDCTLMAFILLYLHGKRGQALSNQMRQQKSMAPDYSIRWWKERGMQPPQFEPVEFLAKRIRWRYAWGTLKGYGTGEIQLGDARDVLPAHTPPPGRRYRLLLTSPPYYGLTCYYYDHWLRYWLLGGPQFPREVSEQWAKESRYNNQKKYRELLQTVFAAAAELLAPDAVIYVRTDAREFTLQVTEEVLREIFSRKRIHRMHEPFMRQPQTALFGDHGPKPGEVDLILTD